MDDALPVSIKRLLPDRDGAVRHLLREAKALHHGGEGGLVVVPPQQELLAHPPLPQSPGDKQSFCNCYGSKYIEFGSGSRILAQFGSGSRVPVCYQS